MSENRNIIDEAIDRVGDEYLTEHPELREKMKVFGPLSQESKDWLGFIVERAIATHGDHTHIMASGFYIGYITRLIEEERELHGTNQRPN